MVQRNDIRMEYRSEQRCGRTTSGQVVAFAARMSRPNLVSRPLGETIVDASSIVHNSYMCSSRRLWFRHPDGRAIDNDDLVETADGWVRPPPIFCPNDHVLRAGVATVGWQACAVTAIDGSCDGHLTYACGICRAVVHRPALGPSCRPTAFGSRNG